ncbi:aminotransferase class I/II-fold pyridoxal phosphate-dependent enzyme [Thermoanaerobacter thermocopriae]|uniref:aminotransferase class I/II-fold pyridoxal phosphate-dependent enzyme n=1 Tax=Thermoanaerobacter thermocopriae TaxID=29350 RepID=UPI000490BFFD|nr:aminotransferase class I/II-fold pyridoxal phosphate-dependent enzyme [Thermoanaerobacter thermocopriae]
MITKNVYGGTFRVFDKIFKKFGIIAKFIDTTDLDVVENAINNNTRAIFIETPTNPILEVTDIRKIAKLSKKYEIITVVDNTWMK